MASSESVVRYIAEQCSGAGTITYRKMFGEYGIYCDGKIFGSVEDDQFYVKPTDAGRAIVPDAPMAEPHSGAHYLLIEQVDDRELLERLVRATYDALPAPKPKKKKEK